MEYFDIIFTLHSQKVLFERGIKLEEAWTAFKYPTFREKQKDGSFKIRKEFDNFTISVIAYQNRKNEWVIKSAWRDPALPGTADARKKEVWRKYNKSGWLGQLWIQLKQQLGF